jgi:acetyltransferase-like isoleucine patch superfamily enzyme
MPAPRGSGRDHGSPFPQLVFLGTVLIGVGIRKVRRTLHARRDPIGYARSIGVRVGEDCRFFCDPTRAFGSEPFLVTLGNHVTVTAGVSFVTHDGGVWVFRLEHPDIDVFGPIVVGDNTFIGIGATLMPGVTIGCNSVIGAGAVVTRDVPSNTVAAGCPARAIRTTAEYWASIAPRATHIRSLPYEEKRRILLERFDPGSHASSVTPL